MTEPLHPRAARANPAPRSALSRVTPLVSVPDVDERAVWSTGHSEATGRDVLIRPGSPPTKPARKGRGAVPALADLMPPSSPHRKKGHHLPPAPELPVLTKKSELVVTVPKPLRKRLKAKAAEHGMTSEQAIAELISVWVDG